MTSRRTLLMLPLVGLAFLASASGNAMGAGVRGTGTASSADLKLIEFPSIQTLGGSIVFRPAGISPALVQGAYVRSGNRRRLVSVAYVREALSSGTTVRVAKPNRDGQQPGAARLARQAGRFRLGVAFWVDSSTTSAAPLGTVKTSSLDPTPSGQAPVTNPPPVVDPPVNPPPVVDPPPASGPPAYFVSPAGSDGNPGTSSRPFKSLGKAYGVAAPGNTVEVAGGNYTAPQMIKYDSSKAGSSDPVTFSASGHAHFKVTQPNSSYWTNVDASHITFTGDFEFDYVNMREDAHGMVGVTFRGTQIHHLAEGGNVNGLYLYDNQLGPNNLWPVTGSTRTANTGPDDILDFGIGKTCSSPQACFAFSAKNVNVVGNRFNGAYHSWDGSHSDCLQYTVGQSGYIADNTFQNCYNETVILRDNLGGLANITIENNYLGVPISASDPYAIHLAPCINCVIRFNSVPATGRLLYASASAQGSTSASGEKVYANIAGKYDGGQCTGSQADGWNWAYNLFIGSSGTCGTHAATTLNPLYSAASALDLQIPLSSPAVDFYRGSDSVPATDIAGTSRPQHGFPDVGAYEAP